MTYLQKQVFDHLGSLSKKAEGSDIKSKFPYVGISQTLDLLKMWEAR
tara:strand:- start:101 stop:241 length:141 start_codon:yes stop_codon:yes gene_type:complete